MPVVGLCQPGVQRVQAGDRPTMHKACRPQNAAGKPTWASDRRSSHIAAWEAQSQKALLSSPPGSP